MPIRDLNSVLATVPGVVVQNDEVYIRGGRNNEVAYYLNGAGTTNLANRSNLVYVPQEAVEELQVQVGGYDVEISGANSGVIKRTIKQGTSEYSGSFSVQKMMVVLEKVVLLEMDIHTGIKLLLLLLVVL